MIPPDHLLSVDIAETREPLFVITSDQDWASEHCVETLLTDMHRFRVTPTLFVTNESPAVARAAANGHVELGIHPNFLESSSHGATPEAVIDHTLSLLTGPPVACRAHCFHENSRILNQLVERGVRVDSNHILFFQSGLTPLLKGSGMLSLPCFWEDDVHWRRGLNWDYDRYSDHFFSPGLKIINIHPFFYSLNIPAASFYEDMRPHIRTLDRKQAVSLRHHGAGCASFVQALIEDVPRRGFAFQTLSSLVARFQPRWVAA